MDVIQEIIDNAGIPGTTDLTSKTVRGEMQWG
jgi:hypothetical protein